MHVQCLCPLMCSCYTLAMTPACNAGSAMTTAGAAWIDACAMFLCMPADTALEGLAAFADDDQMAEGMKQKGSMAWCIDVGTPDMLQQHLTYLRSRMGLSTDVAALHKAFQLTTVRVYKIAHSSLALLCFSLLHGLYTHHHPVLSSLACMPYQLAIDISGDAMLH